MQQETEYQPMTGCPQRLHELVTMEMDPCGLQAKVFSLHIAAAGGGCQGGAGGAEDPLIESGDIDKCMRQRNVADLQTCQRMAKSSN